MPAAPSVTDGSELGARAKLKDIVGDLMIRKVPAYGNSFFYSLGFLSMTSLLMLVGTGIIMVVVGPNWWLTSRSGLFVRGVHLWSTQAFVIFMLLHLLVVFLTSGFKAPRRFTWVLGSLMFFFALMEAEFGYGLRNDFSSQWRVLQASDLYNGSGLGVLVNNLNYAQIYGIHIVVIPLLILALLFGHYLLVRVRGIAKPYRVDVPYRVVPADHRKLFMRGGALIAVILFLAAVFKAPLILPDSIRSVSKDAPGLIAKTVLDEWGESSDTANYSDNINPYAFDTKSVYVAVPYGQYLAVHGGPDMFAAFNALDDASQKRDLDSAAAYFGQDFSVDAAADDSNPAIAVTGGLVKMAQSGLYEAALQGEETSVADRTYATRFLADTGVLEDKAKEKQMTTAQYGMVRDEEKFIPGAWWLTPLGLLDNTLLVNDDNQDRDGAEILGVLLLLFVAFPFIPVLNRLPEKLRLAKFFWRDKS